MPLKIAYLMDPIASINIHKDSSFAMMEATQARGHHTYYFQPSQLFYREGQVYGKMQRASVTRAEDFYQLEPEQTLALADCDAVIMRKDPPFDMRYIYSTYLLERSQSLVINHPAALRNANEKLFALDFPDCIPRSLVSSDRAEIKDFLKQEQKAILKPIDAKGGEGVFVLRADDSNVSALLDMMTEMGTLPVVVQQFVPEASEGDIRVLMLDGEVMSAFRRVPAPGEHRANLNAGAHAVAVELNARQIEICQQVGPTLKAQGLVFVGLDLIGDYLIEINVTSPTGIQEAKRLTGIDLADALIEWIEKKTAKESENA